MGAGDAIAGSAGDTRKDVDSDVAAAAGDWVIVWKGSSQTGQEPEIIYVWGDLGSGPGQRR